MARLALYAMFAAIIAIAALAAVPRSLAQQFQVGVSPPVISMGDVARGESRVVKFFLVTASSNEMLVSLESQRGTLDFFTKDEYKPLMGQYSEQDASGWINFVTNPVELKPSGNQVRTRGGFITGWQEVDFVLNVPGDAEPGYHTVTILPKPSVPVDLGPQGVNIVAVVSTNLLFRVAPGEAARKAEVLDVTSEPSGNRYHIRTFVKNTGTVTISCQADRITVSDSSTSRTFKSSLDFIGPGETVALSSYLDSSELPAGSYQVGSDVSCATVSSSKQASISLTGASVAIPPLAGQGGQPSLPLYLIAIPIAAAIAYLIYKRD
ncbi:MAG: hypothetical protein HY367_02695 [Candidatus Aenigmarchaeota archaeon]|nr:hypothetical protein [Candidatus Aenigmarchaeota archaeon]